ncbi:MAG: DNA primase, partial [Chloroflexi bacterium]|nr:DNA primase [Chloroflexota bacterium]
EFIHYVRRLFGSCITGLLTEHIIVFLYGTGANGKSTLLRTLRALAGDYAYHSRPEVFMAKRGDTQGFELVNLAGARLVTCAETGARRKLDEGLVKEMTGGEPITCAPKYGDFFTYQPVFKPILATNHKPQIMGVDEGIWRRVQLVPFTVTIPKEEWDLTLYEKLVDELPGILNWTLQGVAEFLDKGLSPPAEVTAATKAYRDEQDVLSGWLEENCVLHADATDVYGELYNDYTAWCEANGDDAMSKTEFSSSLDQRGCEAKRGAKGKRMRLHIARRTVVGDG